MRPLLLLAAGLALAGCGGNAAASDRPTVVATTTQLADVARNVGGDAVTVHQILQPNTDPHEYEPRPGDVKATAGAKVVLASGAGLDHWIGDIAHEAGGVRVVTVDRQGGDPHWWHDPRRMEAAVTTIRAALGQVAPAAGERDRAARRRLHGQAAAAGRRHQGVHRPRARRAAQARHEPRRVRLLRPPLRHHDRRRRHPVAVHRGAAVRRADQRAGDARPRASTSRRSTPRARSTRSSPRRSRTRRARGPTSRCTATRSARRARRATRT